MAYHKFEATFFIIIVNVLCGIFGGNLIEENVTTQSKENSGISEVLKISTESSTARIIEKSTSEKEIFVMNSGSSEEISQNLKSMSSTTKAEKNIFEIDQAESIKPSTKSTNSSTNNAFKDFFGVSLTDFLFGNKFFEASKTESRRTVTTKKPQIGTTATKPVDSKINLCIEKVKFSNLKIFS